MGNNWGLAIFVLLAFAFLLLLFITGKETTVVRDLSNLDAGQTILGARVSKLEKTLDGRLMNLDTLLVDIHGWTKPAYLNEMAMQQAKTDAIASMTPEEFQEHQDMILEGLRQQVAQMSVEEFGQYMQALIAQGRLTPPETDATDA